MVGFYYRADFGTWLCVCVYARKGMCICVDVCASDWARVWVYLICVHVSVRMCVTICIVYSLCQYIC